jgi:hypothetical protein
LCEHKHGQSSTQTQRNALCARQQIIYWRVSWRRIVSFLFRGLAAPGAHAFLQNESNHITVEIANHITVEIANHITVEIANEYLVRLRRGAFGLGSVLCFVEQS